MVLVTALFDIFDTRVLVLTFVVFYLVRKLINQPKNLPPGPWPFPVIGNIPYFARSGKEFPEALIDLSKIYGNVFMVKLGSQRTLVLSDFKSIQEGMNHPHLQDRPQSDDYRKEFCKMVGSELTFGVTNSNGTTWSQLRKFMVKNFRDFGIGKSQFEDVISTEAYEMREALRLKIGHEFDPMIVLNNALSNIICSITFGKRYQYDDKKFIRLLELLNRQFELLGTVTLLSTFPLLLKLRYGPIKELIENGKEFHEFFSGIIRNHEESYDENEIDDLMYSFLREIHRNRESGGNVFNPANLKGIAEELFFAGVDSSATTVRWFLLFMIREPDIQRKFQEEMDLVIGRNRTPRWTDRHDMPFVNACILEAQRLGNASALGGPHCASEDTTAFGYHIPKGTMVLPNLLALFMDVSLWKDPELFNPERFLNENKKVEKPEYLIPFNVGPRQCPAEQLANMELFIFTTHLLHWFTFSLPEGAPLPSIKGKMGITYKAQPFELIIKERD